MLKQLLYILNGLVQEKEIVLGPSLIAMLKKINDKVSNFILVCATENLDLDIDYSFIETIPEDGMVSFLKTRWEADAPNKFESNRREKMKISRLVMALASKKGVVFSNAEIEEFINKYKASQKFEGGDEDVIKLIKGDDIIHYYNSENYQSGGGAECSLYKSCMRYAHCSEYFSVYAKNPNVALCVLLSPEKKVEARAVVWFNAMINEQPAIYMDRIYSINDGAERAMKEYAIKNNWWFKTKQTSSSDEYTNGAILLTRPVISSLLPKGIEWNIRAVKKPYMDTLSFLKYVLINNDVLFCLINNSNEWYQHWDSQNGMYDINNSYKNPYEGLIKVSQILNVPIADVKKLDDEHQEDNNFDFYDVGDKCYRYVDYLNRSDYDVLISENPHLIDELVGSIDNFQNGRMLVVDIKPEISEYISNNLEEVFYQSISLNSIKELLRANSEESNKEILKDLLNKHFTFFKNNINITDGVVVLPTITKLFDEIGNNTPSMKEIIGRVYKKVSLEKHWTPPTSLKDKYKESDWIRIKGDYSNLHDTPIPKQYVKKIEGFVIGDKKNKDNINNVLNLFNDKSKQIIILNIMASAIFIKYNKGAILKREVVLGDRIIVNKDDQSRRSVPNGVMGDVVKLNGNEVNIIFYDEVENGGSLDGICEDGWGKVISRKVISPIDKEFKLPELSFLLDNSDKTVVVKNLFDVFSLHSYKQLIKLFHVDMDAFIENVDMAEVVNNIINKEDLKNILFDAISINGEYKYDKNTNSLLYWCV